MYRPASAHGFRDGCRSQLVESALDLGEKYLVRTNRSAQDNQLQVGEGGNGHGGLVEGSSGFRDRTKCFLLSAFQRTEQGASRWWRW